MKNYDRALQDIVHQPTGHTHVLVVQDDILFLPDALKTLWDAFKHKGDSVVLSAHAVANDVQRLRQENKVGFQPNYLGWETWTAGANCYPTGILRRLIKHGFYRMHVNLYKPGTAIDACISHTLQLLKVQLYHHIPSLSHHVSESTIAHGGICSKRSGFFTKNQPEHGQTA